MSNQRLKALRIAKVVCGVLVAIVILLIAAFLAYLQPGGSGVLASLRLRDGSGYMVTQRCNWGGEPYTVAFYMRAADGPWGWCYIDHQAMRWRDVAMHYDDTADTIVITERGARRAALDRKRRMFWIDTWPPGREVPAPQDTRDPDYEFPSDTPTA